MATTATEDYEIKYRLAKCVLQGEWRTVIDIYEKYEKSLPEVHAVRIASSGGTALHVAVSDEEEDTVDKLVKIISADSLLIEDEQGNTPLHIAAATGSLRMCRSIAEGPRREKLLRARNKEDESPFFVAARRGRTDAFLYLHSLLKDPKSIAHCRRKDGETVLHCAISEDHFDLAFRIIELYKDQLATSVNERGISPLHLLATKPSAFKSGTYLGPFSKVIYHIVANDCPPNYETCCYFIGLLKKMVKSERRRNKQRRDVEEPSGSHSNLEVENYEHVPPNCQSCVAFVEIVLFKPMEAIFGLGLTWVRKIRDQKRKNFCVAKILELLLTSTKEYTSGGSPHQIFWDTTSKSPTLSDIPSFSELKKKETNADSSGNEEENKEAAKQEAPISTTAENRISEMVNEILKNFLKETNAKSGGNKEEGIANGETPQLTAVKNKISKMVHKILKSSKSKEEIEGIAKGETPLLTAAKNGISEMVQGILQKFPEAIYDNNPDKKNAVLLAAEHRRPDVFRILDKMITIKDPVFGQADKEGNSALHLAALLEDDTEQKNNPVPPVQINSEIEWYELVKKSMPFRFVRHNCNRKTPDQIFTETHKKLFKDGRDWYINTSQSCSVVASLIATVAFATSATVPGGIREGSGSPNLQNQPAFMLFAISSPIALCFSITSVIMFLSILTSQFREEDFKKYLPKMLFVGIFSLFVSMASMLVSFCAGHFFILKDKLKFTALPVYVVVCLPIALAIANFLYSEIAMATRVG